MAELGNARAGPERIGFDRACEKDPNQDPGLVGALAQTMIDGDSLKVLD